jgi:hypothetical protein
MNHRFTVWMGGLFLLATSCAASTQKPAIDAALSDPQMRQESLEATLRVMDENPEYVDELFSASLRHPKTLDRFLKNTARELERDEFARFVAARLVTSPTGVKRVLISTLDAASNKPEVLKAVSEAMAERPQLAAIVVVQTEESVRGTIRALLVEVLKNPDARRYFLKALAENSEPMASVIVPNPEVMKVLLKAFVHVGIKKGEKELAAFAKALE